MKTAYRLIYATFLFVASLALVGSASAAATYTMQGTLALSSGSDPLALNGQAFTATVTLNNPQSTNTTSGQSTGTYTGVTSMALSAGALGPLNCSGAGANLSITDNVTGNDQVQFNACILSISSWSGSIQIQGGGIVTSSPAAVPLTNVASGQVAYTVLGQTTVFNVTNATVSATGAAAPNITANPTSFSPAVNAGSNTVQQRVIDLSASSPVSYAVSKTGGSWLTFSPSTGNTSSDVTISANPTGLAEGVYNGSVTVNSGQGTPAVVTVTLTVNPFVPPTLSANPTSLTFNYALGGAAPASQQVNITATSAASITVASSNSWLQVTPLSGTTPRSLTVSINTSGLAVGTLNGSLTITSAGATNTPLVVPVTLNVTPQTTISVSPSQLSFSHQLGASAPAAKLVSLSGLTGGAFTAAASSTGNWLSVSPTAGTSPAQLTVSVNPAGLAAGQFSGSVTVTAPGASNSPRVVSVTLTVTTDTLLTANPAQLLFSSAPGSAAPAPQQIAVAAGGAAIPFSVALSSASWATLGSTGGTTPRSVSVSVNPTGLAPGVYEATASITSAGAVNSPLLVPIKFTISAQPTFTSQGVVNAASFAPGLPPAPGGLASVFGVFPGTVFAQASAIPLPDSLSDVSITLTQNPSAALTEKSGVNRQSVSVDAPLLFVSGQQINFQVPWEIQPGTSQMVVTVGGLASAPVAVDFESTSPAVFTLDYGPGRAIAFMTGGALAQPVGSIPGLLTRPARVGEPLIIFATGLGPMTGPPMESGNNSLDAQGNYVLRETLAVPKVFVGGQEAAVIFSGASPEFVGVYQINLQAIPAGVQPGAQVPLVIQLGDIVSREGVSIAVEPAAPQN